MNWKTLLKLGFTVLLLVVLGYQLDLRTLASVIMSAHLGPLLLAVLLQLSLTLIAVFRWKIILSYFTIQIPYLQALRIVFMGNFFSLFLPSAIGGDVFRAYYVSRRTKKGLSHMLTTTFLDRSAGLGALLLIGLCASLSSDIAVGGVRLSRVFMGFALIYFLISVAVFHDWSHRATSRLVAQFGFDALDEKFQLIYEGLRALIRAPVEVFVIFGLSLIIQLVAVCVMWFAALSLNFGSSFGVFLVFIPLINLSIMVPITINGFGLRENLYLILFAELGTQDEMAVALGLLQAFIVMMVGLPGGPIYGLYRAEAQVPDPATTD